MKTRIVKLNDKYIVQAKNSYFSPWRGIDIKEPYRWQSWYSWDAQMSYCAFASLEEAREFRLRYSPGLVVIE